MLQQAAPLCMPQQHYLLHMRARLLKPRNTFAAWCKHSCMSSTTASEVLSIVGAGVAVSRVHR